MPLRVLTIRIPVELFDRLSSYSRESGSNWHDVIVFALIRYLEVVGWLYGV